MKVRCIEADPIGTLQNGKTYTVERESESFYWLTGLARHGGWYKDRFEVVGNKSNDPFAGKTILRVNSRSVNVKKFYFTDGTGVELWTECGSGSFAIPFFEVKKFTYKLRPCGRIGKVTYFP